MSWHDEMMATQGLPCLMLGMGDSGRVVCYRPGDTPLRVPLDVTGIGQIQGDQEIVESGAGVSTKKIERVTISLEIESAVPANDWKVEIDGDIDKPWTIDTTSSNANGAINLHCKRSAKMKETRRGLEAR